MYCSGARQDETVECCASAGFNRDIINVIEADTYIWEVYDVDQDDDGWRVGMRILSMHTSSRRNSDRD